MKLLVLFTLLISATSVFAAGPSTCAPHLDQDIRKLRSSETINLCEEFAGKPLLVVNTASHCGFTRQFAGLEKLYQSYKDRGFAVVGMPSDDFWQAAKDEESAARICYINFGVTFTMLSEQEVRGSHAHPLFKELSRTVGAPSWNFNKYLLDRSGKVVKRFGSSTEPMSRELRDAVEALL